MSKTRKPRVSMPDQIRLINQCRQSGMTDAEWCRENGICHSTFYTWIKRCKQKAADQIPKASYGQSSTPRPKQEIVPIDIIPDPVPDQLPTLLPDHAISKAQNFSHTIEIAIGCSTLKISNNADPELLARTLRVLRELSC